MNGFISKYSHSILHRNGWWYRKEITNNINHDNHHWPYNSSNFKPNPRRKTFYDKLKALNLNFWLVYMCKACSTIMNGEMVRNLGFKLNLQGKNIECLALKIINIEIMACYPMKPPCFCILNFLYKIILFEHL